MASPEKIIRNYLNNSPVYLKLLLGLILVTVIGLIDYYTKNEISLSIFYLLPISLVTWYIGKSYGIAFSVLCAFVWYYVDFLNMHSYSSPPVPYWNAMVRLGFFLIVVILMTKTKNLKNDLEALVKKRTSELVKEVNEHKKSKEEIIQKSELLRELNKKIETIREEQNIRIAREIHDELGQSLTAINLELNWISKKHSANPDIVARVSALSSIVSDTIGTVRRISSDLRPRLLDQLGILPAIESQLKDFENRTSIKVSLSLPEEQLKLENTTATTIYRILQEALTNIARHSGCTKTDVKIWLDKNDLCMSVKDNGAGFDNSTNGTGFKSLGIAGMKERAKILNGNIDIISQKGIGTEIILRTPVNYNL